MMACQNLIGSGAFAPGMLAYLDCQAQELGSSGYQALAAPGSSASVLLTGMITLLIAFTGYRMLLGHSLTIREGMLTIVKIGLVLAFATSWPAYQAVVYDLILRAPAEFAASVGGASQVPGATGGLAQHLEGVDQAIKTLAIQGVGAPPVGPDRLPRMPSVAPPLFLHFDNFALGFSRVAFLVSAIAPFAIVRMTAGLLLALGPLFIAFLLFDGTRGLFEGWAKGLIGSALAAFAITLVLGVELAFLEPWLVTLLDRRSSGLDILGAPGQLLAATTIFAIGLLMTVWALGRVAASLRVPAWAVSSIAYQRSEHSFPQQANPAGENQSFMIEQRSRASAVADAVMTSQRREEGAAAQSLAASLVGRNASGRTSEGQQGQIMQQNSRTAKRSEMRVSARAMNRDRIT